MIVDSKDIDAQLEHFVREGYIIVKKAIGRNLYEEMWDVIINLLNQLESKEGVSNCNQKDSIEKMFHDKVINLVI